MEEVWLPVKGHIGSYWVSNTGKIKNKHGRILKTFISRGYERVALCAREKHPIHRLVAEAFLPNPFNFPCINHRDENKLNNSVENLQWCDYKTNNSYGTRGKRIAEKTEKPVYVFKDGVFCFCCKSQLEAAQKTQVSKTTISRCIKTGSQTKQGYQYKRNPAE